MLAKKEDKNEAANEVRLTTRRQRAAEAAENATTESAVAPSSVQSVQLPSVPYTAADQKLSMPATRYALPL